MSIHLLGGGWADDESRWTGRFVAEARERAEGAPVIVCVLWAKTESEGAGWHDDYVDDLTKLGAGEVRIVQLTPERQLQPTDLGSAEGIFVGGGLTPGYHAATMPAADTIRGLVASGVPYAGFSAGAMIAGDVALLGGWRENTSLIVGSGGLQVAGDGSVWTADRAGDTDRVAVGVLAA
ncbi:Type 1 glutamine amidotransferase-like domain-containing protein [Agrococcus sediminis]|uniref:Type 1 glutamine amidotransferase-like domain-containing protein n=1 Tax=Agrococcus sediminis TaxID=2599924 RepID=UPI00343012D2